MTTKKQRIQALAYEHKKEPDWYALEELDTFKDIEYHQGVLFKELVDSNNIFIDYEQASLIVVTLRQIFEQSHATKIDTLKDYKRFSYWAYWTYGITIQTHRHDNSGYAMARVKVLPREVFDDIRYGGLTDKQIKTQYCEFPDHLEWILPQAVAELKRKRKGQQT